MAVCAAAAVLACDSTGDVDPIADATSAGDDADQGESPDASGDGVDAGGDAGDSDNGANGNDVGLVLVGGALADDPGSDDPLVADTWLWDGEGWSDATPGLTVLSPRRDHGLAYDEGDGRVILFGGFDGDESLGDTWAWDGESWDQLADSAPSDLSTRSQHALAYDSTDVILFGGRTIIQGLPDQTRGDTWRWNGVAWSEASPSQSPSNRYGHALAYDEAREMVVLFGGRTTSTSEPIVNDTWVWESGQWTELDIEFEDAPEQRYEHALAYDPEREVVVLYGGRNFGGLLADTWEWDGTEWEAITVGGGDRPGQRSGHAMAYDPNLEAVILIAGEDDDGEKLSDRWAWDGSSWELLSASGSVDPARSHAALSQSPLQAR